MKEFFKDSKNIIILGLVVAILGSLFYWYACMNKGLCKMRYGAKQPVKVVEQIKMLDGRETYGNISKTPLVIYFDASTSMPVVAAVDAELKALAKYAVDNSKNIYVTGHTKYGGSWAKSNEISLANAKAVKDILLANGATSTKVYASGKGYDFPVFNFKNTDEVNNRAVISVDAIK
jgi:outer membrane protein OmpA-like peptidoglycan-associated protein